MHRFKNILCVIDTESNDNVALEYAVMLAENNQATLNVIEVIDEIPPNTKLLERILAPEDLQAKIVKEKLQRLDERVTPWKTSVEIEINILSGIPYLEIIKEVLRHDRDLVIKTAESEGLLDRVFGSDDMHLLRKCPCSVWLAKPNFSTKYKRILAAVDVDDNYPAEQLKARSLLNHRILEIACSLSLPESAELHVVDTWNAIGEDTMRLGFIEASEDKINTYVEEVKQYQANNLDLLMNEVANKIGPDTMEYINPQMHLIKGTPRKSVPELAKTIEAEIVVMGTVSRTGISGYFIGNTAECILNQLNCSVLALKPPGFVTPITLDD